MVSLDDTETLRAATIDPTGFIAELNKPACIDEVQRAPDLMLPIKQDVDTHGEPGRYLLTGSSNLLHSTRIGDALTGRIETVRIWPLAQSEIHGSSNNFVDALFANDPPRISNAPVGRRAFVSEVAAGGYPEAMQRSPKRRDLWFSNYVENSLGRDLRDISDAHKLKDVPRLLRYFAAQSANLVSYRNIGKNLELSHPTVQDYVGLLEELFIVRLLPAWRPGLAAREVHAPKGYVVDSGLLTNLLSANEKRIANDDQITGKAFETFVAMEVLKHAEWAEIDSLAYHYRQRDHEIDLLLENRAGDVVAIEVKAAASTDTRALRPMKDIRDRLGSRFKCGIVVYTGTQTLPLGDRLWVVPVSGLWH